MSKWEMVRLGDYIEQIRGVSYKPEDVRNEDDVNYIPILRAHNIQSKGLNNNNLVYVNKRKIQEKQYIAKGDIVVCASSGSKDLVGKAAQSDINLVASFGAFCKVVRPTKKINPLYLKQYFLSPLYRHIISELSSGANINNLRNEHIDELLIPFPPLPIQKKIADILDRTSALIEKRKAQIEKLDLLIKSQFMVMFGDPMTNPMGWDVKRLGDIIKITSSKRVYQSEQTSDGVPFLRVSDLVSRINDGVNSCELYISDTLYNEFLKNGLVPKEGDLLVTARGTLGLCYIVNKTDRFYFQDGMISWLSEKKQDINSTYLSYLFQSNSIKNQINNVASGTAVSYLSIANLGKFDILYPPVKLQNRFADFVCATDKSKYEMQQGLDYMELLYKSLIQKCFSGELFSQEVKQ